MNYNIFVTFLVMPCETPTATGSIYSCEGSTTDFGETCQLTCENGYIGEKTLTCNVDNGDGTASWDSTPAYCTIGKELFVNKYRVFFT